MSHSQLLEQLAAERSPLKANKILRTIEDRFTPVELHEALPAFEALTGVPREVALLSDILEVLQKEPPQRYVRTDLADRVALFSDPAATGEKSLIIAFCGRSYRLMTPWTLFLQMLPSSRFDVLILADVTNDHFLKGVVDYAPGFLPMVRRIQRDVPFGRYRRVYSFGTSTGGLPALRFGLLTGIHRAISVGGQITWHVNRLLSENSFDAFDPLCACPWPRRSQLICVYGERSRLDVRASRQMQLLVGARLVKIEGSEQHNVIYEIFRAGRLRQLYSRLFEFAPGSTR